MGDDRDLNLNEFFADEWDDNQVELFLNMIEIYNKVLREKELKQMELTDAEFISYQEGGGTFAIERLLQRLAAATESAPKAAFPDELDIYEDSDAYRRAHYKITQCLRQDGIDQVDCVFSTIGSVYQDVLAQLLEQGVNIQILFTKPAFETIQTDVGQSYTSLQSPSDWLHSTLDHERAKIYVSTIDISAELFILDDTVCVGLYSGDEGRTNASGGRYTSLIGTDPQLYNWATDLFSYHYDNAQQVTEVNGTGS